MATQTIVAMVFLYHSGLVTISSVHVAGEPTTGHFRAQFRTVCQHLPIERVVRVGRRGGNEDDLVGLVMSKPDISQCILNDLRVHLARLTVLGTQRGSDTVTSHVASVHFFLENPVRRPEVLCVPVWRCGESCGQAPQICESMSMTANLKVLKYVSKKATQLSKVRILVAVTKSQLGGLGMSHIEPRFGCVVRLNRRRSLSERVRGVVLYQWMNNHAAITQYWTRQSK